LAPSGVSTIIYFASEDCAIEEKMIPELGGKIHKSKMSIGEYGFIALAMDPEGNMIGFHSMN
jgi:predicted enzyme related to lactoylglutathione lyase